MSNISADKDLMTALAARRSRVYEILLLVFVTVDEKELAQFIKRPELAALIDGFMASGDPELEAGAARVKDYLDAAKTRDPAELTNELAVDRTALLRAPGQGGFKPPYEGLYLKQKPSGEAPLAVKTFYRQAGMLPDECVCESPDFLCLELDFMRQLCLKERAARESEDHDPAGIMRMEYDFLDQHLGAWVGDYVALARDIARTDFFAGFLTLLSAAIARDKEFLAEALK